MNMNKLSFASTYGRLALFVGAAVIALWAFLAVAIDFAYRSRDEALHRELEDLSWSFAEVVQSSVQTIDLATIDLRDHWTRQPKNFAAEVEKLLGRLESNTIFQVAVADARGNVVYSNLQSGVGKINIGDRLHFRIHRDRQADELFISKPVLGRLSGRWSLQFTRGIRSEKGEFKGVIIVSVPPEYFTRFSEVINARSGGVSVMLDKSGHLYARQPRADHLNGASYLEPRTVESMQRGSLGWFDSLSPIDQMERIHIWRKVDERDLFVVLGVSRQEALHAYFIQREMFVLGGAVATAILLAIAILFASHLRRMRVMTDMLAENEQRLQFALEGSGEGVWDWQMNKDSILLSPQWSSILGFNPGELKASYADWESRVHPADRDRTLSNLWAHMKGQSERFSSEYRIRCKDGDWKWVQSNGLVIRRDAKGHATRFVGTLSDISERRNSQLQIEEWQRFLINLTDALPNLVCYWRPDGTSRFTNKAFRSVFPALDSDNPAQTMPDIIGRDLFAKTASYFEATIRGEKQQFDCVFTTADGHVRAALASYLPDMSDGKVVGVFAVVTDVTGLKETQLELQRMNEKLLASNQLANEASLAKSAFVAHISHEIRTPLNSIIGMTEMALIEQPASPVRPHLDVVKSSATSLSHLITDLLELSKLEAGKVALANVAFNLSELLEQTMTAMAVLAEKKSLRLGLQVVPEMPGVVFGDAERLKQVLINLLGNAVKFTQRGSVMLFVSHELLQPDQLLLRFTVTDSGCGIEPDELARIFEPFFQGPSAALRSTIGTGLGLSISKNIVELMGGKIEVKSTPGAGSAFSFEIRANFVVYPDSFDPKASAETPFLERSTRSLHILLVDDYPSNQVYAVRVLEHLGHAVMLAEDGKQALDLAKKNTFDCILMDLQMPVMDGYESTRNIREYEKLQGRARTLILAMTAESTEAEIKKAYASGVDDILLKPFTPAALAERL